MPENPPEDEIEEGDGIGSSVAVADLESDEARPWQALRDLTGSGQAEELEAFLDTLSPGETARAIARLDETTRTSMLTLIDPEDAADVLDDLSVEQAADLIEEMQPAQAAEIFEELPADEQADILSDMSSRDADAVLDEMAPEDAAKARSLMGYDAESAGGLMIAEFLSFRQDLTTDDVLANLREHRDEYSDYEVQYAYVTDGDGALVGVLRLRDLMLSARNLPIERLMIPSPLSVPVSYGLDDMVGFFEDHEFLGVPVVDADGRLVGVLRQSVVREAVERRAKNVFLKVSGIIGGEELRSLPLRVRCLRRLSWLCPNIVLNIIAASVISMYQETLQAVIVLAVFLPIISDMSGCAGNQAVAVSIRELAMGLIRPREVWRVFMKEGALGIINGIALGVLLGSVAAIWQGNMYLGLVVGTALALNTLLSVLLGGLVPLVLKGFKIDPALASGPILTTVTDMCGFFLVLSFASMTLEKLS
jgi:magnesium transporter